jgi:hypothetical protein
VVSLGISGLGSLIGKLRGSYTDMLLKLPCVTNVELAVMSSPGVLHLKKKLPRHYGPPPRNPIPRHQQQQRPTPAKKAWVPKKPHRERPKTLEKKTFYEGTPFVSSFMRDLVRYLELQLKKRGQDKEEDAHSPKGSGPT